VELAPDVLISMRFPERRALRSRPEAASEEEARAHAFAVFAVFVVPNQATIYVAMSRSQKQPHYLALSPFLPTLFSA
jgi:hypothetical protein